MQYDLIVVGGGHNGLVCAAYAAAAGLRVLALERHERVGGAAITEEFHPGFRNSAASYTVSLLEPGIIQDLNLGAHGLRIVPRPLDNFAAALDGPGLELSGDARERIAAIAKFSQHDAAVYGDFARELGAALELLRPLLLEAPIDPTADGREFLRALKVVARTLRAGPRALAACRRLFSRSAAQWLDDLFETDLLKGALGFDSIVGHLASPYAVGTAYLLLHHAWGEIAGRRGAWGHAIGGMGSIAEALAAAARRRGVEIRTGEPVERIVPTGAGFTVHTPTTRFTSRLVAGGVHPQTLFLDLLADYAWPEPFRQSIAQWRSESGSFRVNVALAELPQFRCRPGTDQGRHHGAGILLMPSLDYMARAYDSALAQGYSAQPIIEIVIPSVIDSTLAPRGAHVASLFCQHFRYRLADGQTWAQSRGAAIDRIIATVDEFAPNFARSIVGLKAYSPADLATRFGLVGGDIFHGQLIRGQLYHERPAKHFARYHTPLPGLYLCASGAHPGGGVSGLPGKNAAAAIVADWQRRGD